MDIKPLDIKLPDKADELQEISKRAKVEDKNSVEYAAGQFESLMVNQMLKEMSNSVQREGLFGEDNHEAGIWRDMFNQAVADEIVKGKGIGLKEYLTRQLSKFEK